LPEGQQRFVNPEDCFWKDVYGKHNDWHIVTMKPTGENKESIKIDVAEARHDILHHISAAITASVEKGKIGAVSSPTYDQAPNGYFLVEFIDEPGPGDDQCNTYQLNVVPGASKWWTRSETLYVVDMIHVVDTDVKVEPVSASNMPPTRVRSELTNHTAVKISEESHNFALDEIWRRDQLEYDPNLVDVSGEDVHEVDIGDAEN